MGIILPMNFDWHNTLMLIVALFSVAMLYSSVGHGGASGYLMVFALAGMAPASMRPTALAMNLGVTLLATIAFFRAGAFRWHLLWPFLVASIPFAWLGGTIQLKDSLFGLLLGISLLAAASRLVLAVFVKEGQTRKVPLPVALLCGAIIGLISGLIGVGGGIFLTPLLILFRWADARSAAAVTAPFIFLNSVAGLFGMGSRHAVNLHPGLCWFLLAALAGGWIGACWGGRTAAPRALRGLLAFVLMVAAMKLLFA